MSDVIFITPNLSGSIQEEPLGTLLLSTILRNGGIQSDILSYHHFGSVDFFDQFISTAIETVLALNPRIVSFYTRCDTYHISIRLAECIKAKLQNTYIVFGGPQSDLSAMDSLRELPFVDYICCGEGEKTILPFFSSLLADSPDLTTPGLVFRSSSGIISNPRPELISDLDTLPVIDYSLVDFSASTASRGVKKLFPVDVGRGCPFACTYCSTKSFWGRTYRLKSPERIVNEITYIYRTFGISGFIFEHDMFTMNRKMVSQTCHLLKKANLPIHWRCSARIDCLDEELIDLMADAGMQSIFLGIESGSPRIQKLIKKNLDLDLVPKRLKYISSKGLKATVSFIYGFPEETEEDLSQTIALMAELQELPHITIQHHLCAFLPGTELTSQYHHQLVNASVTSNITGDLAVSKCEDIIRNHPSLFPHLCEFQTSLRAKSKFLPQFFFCWTALRPVYAYIAEKYYKNHLCDMLFDFSESNNAVLISGHEYTAVLNQDKFLDRFQSDSYYTLLKELSRFLLWRRQAQLGSSDVFGFDVKSFLSGTTLSEINKAVCIVSVVKNSNGIKSLTIRNMAK